MIAEFMTNYAQEWGVFTTLLLKMIPLYAYVGLGFLAGRLLHIEGKNVALLVFYIISPLVLFHAIARLDITFSILSLLLLVYGISVLLGVTFYHVGKRSLKDQRANVLSLMAGTANTGYFGLPIALFMFGEEIMGIYIIAFLGMNLFENTVGFVLASKNAPNYVQERNTWQRLAHLPQLYSLFFGVLFGMFHLPIPTVLNDFFLNLRGCYIVMGMMIVGLGIARMKKVEVDMPFLSLAFFAKFVCWPVLAVLVVWADSQFFHIYNDLMHASLILLSITPLAANAVSIASILGVHPDKVATTVLISTAAALFFVPVFIAFYF